MNKIIKFIFHKVRTLRVSILTLFLSLIIISFIAVLTFTNSAVEKSVQSISRELAQHLSDDILEQFQLLANSSQRAIELEASVYKDMGALSFENKSQMALMSNLVRLNPHITSIYVGQADGELINVIDQSKTAVRTYQFDPEKQLPLDTAYTVVIFGFANSSTKNGWYYLNSDFEVIASEFSEQFIFNVTERPWYTDAVKNKGLAWSGFYTFTTGEKGISVSMPIFNSQGEIEGVIAADLTLDLLSRFLAGRTIGKSGKAFVVDSSGKIVFPQINELGTLTFTPHLVTRAYQHYLVNHGENDFLFEHGGVKFMTHVSDMPPILGTKNLKIVIMAPFDDFFYKILRMWHEVFLIIVAILIISALIVIYFSDRISSPIVTLSKEIDKLRNLQLEREAAIRSNVKEIILMDTSVAAMRRALRSISRYVPKEIVKELFQKGKDIVLGGEKKEITIFFSDIAGFTAIAETQPIDTLIPLLSEYFDFMSKTILDSGGTIDKYMGDGIMAFWGAPLDIPDHAARACLAALQCTRRVDLLNRQRKADGKPEFQTRFGINTGTVIVGNIGTSERMNYTVIGDAVNTTFRLQDIDKYYHTKIIISDDVYKKLGKEFIVRPLDLVAVKGRTEKTKIYELIGLREGAPDLVAKPEEIALCHDFAEAYEAFYQGNYRLAKTLFSAIAQKFPQDYSTAIYLQRLEDLNKS